MVIDPSVDGISQVTKALEGLRDVERVDFLTYGRPGQVEFGAGGIDSAALHMNATQIAGWRDHLADSAQIQFWGCDVGAGSAGSAFVSDLHALTGVTIAASIDATGIAALGGNWSLERTAGTATSGMPFSTEAVGSFLTVLDAPVPTVTLTGLPSQILLGDTFSATATFDNTATTGVGYGPYIDLFVPMNSLDKVTLTSANLLGQQLAISSLTLSTTVEGHLGVLGALHPLLLDSSGAPQFITAPGTAQEGDRVYVLELPFGSFTADQTAEPVTLNFQIDKTSVLTNQHAGQLVDIGAIGGFAYGADALNNPSVDPGLRGVSGTAPGNSTSANGLVSASASVVLVRATAEVTTEFGEGETATGPDFEAHLRLTITPAPATEGNPLTGTTATINLPDTVQYTGGPITITGAPGATATFIPAATAQGGSVAVSIPTIEAPGTIVIDVPVFVPETAADGTPILAPDTGAPTQVSFTTATVSDGAWMPWDGSADEGLPYTIEGTFSTPVSITARSLAVQVSAFDITSGSTTNFRPGDIVEYSLKFQVSDYFDFDSLSLDVVLDDGFTVNPGIAPILTLVPAGGGASTTINLGTISGTTTTINGQLVATSGSNASWNFTRSGATGETAVSLTPAISAPPLTPELQSGVTGVLTFRAQVLDKYTHSHVDPFTSSGGSITERDSVQSSVSGAGTVVNNLGIPVSPTAEVSDSSQSTLTIPQGTGRVFVAAINGQVVSLEPGTTTNVQPGDTVTYGINYNLITGDYRSLLQSAFMPLPIVSVADPMANGSTVTEFVLDTAPISPEPGVFLPGAGKYVLHLPSTGMTIASADVDAVSNGITFDFGHRDDTTNAAGQRATVLFSFVVTTAPFADGMSLTAQGETALTNSSGTSDPNISLSGVTLNEPDLTQSAKTGIASLVNNSLAPKTGGYTVEATGASADPSTLYDPAGTSGNPFVNGSLGPTIVGDLQDLNVTGADGSDTVRVIMTIGNVGASSGGAFDVTVAAELPAGYTIADVSNITATRSGGLVVSLVPNAAYGITGTLADLFTANGVMLEDPGSTVETPRPTLFGVNDIAHRNVLTVSYDLKLHPGQSAGSVLTGTGKIVNYSNIFDGVAQGNGFVVDGVPVGGTAADLINTATVTTTSPTMPKTFGPSDTPQNDNVDPSHPNATVVVGNTRPVTITVNLPEGSLNNGSGNVLVTELLPANEIFRNLVSVTAGPGVTLLSGAGTASVSGNTVTFDLGAVVTNTNADAPGTVTITYNAYFADGANVDGTLFTSTANLVYSGAPIAPATVTFVEHDPSLSASLTDNAGGVVYTDRTVTYTYTVRNNGIVESQATESLINLPTALLYVPGSLQLVSRTNTPSSSSNVDDSAGATGTLTVDPGVLEAGGVLVYTFQATVAPNLTSGTALTVAAPPATSTGLSIAAPQAPAVARDYSFSASDTLSVRTLSTTLLISGEANGTTVISAAAPVTSANVTIGDITRLHGQVLLPEGQNSNVVLDFLLPSGLLPFISDGTIKLALISDTGSIQTSTLDPAGNIAGLQVAQGSAAINPSTFTPTYVLPASAIDTTSQPGHILVSLGTVTDNAVSPLPNYAVLEFNAIVANIAANQAGVALTPSLLVAANGASSPSSSVTETIVEPTVTMQKVVTAIDTGAGSVDYRITLTNTGNATAYALTLTDPLPENTASITNLSNSGSATNVVVAPGGASVFVATMTMAAGQSHTFTYTMTVADAGAPVPATTATETYRSLNPSITSAFGSTVGPVGSATGSRDGSSLPAPGLNDYWQQVTTSLGTATGQIWQALGDAPDTFDSATDTLLSGVTVTHTSPGPDGTFGTADDLHQTTTSGVIGRWFFGLIPNGTFRITLPASGSNGLPASETLVVNAFGNLTTLPAQANGTAIGGAISGMNFVYELPNTAPVLSNWSDETQVIVPNQVVNLSNTFGTSVADTQLDVLVAADQGYSYQGTVLTVRRYNGSTTGASPIPDANDIFGGDGDLVLSGGTATLNGIVVGTFVQAAGTLSLTFGAGTTAASVRGVLNHLTYSTSGALNPAIHIGATLSDANANNVPLAGGATTGRQGTGGVMTSAPVFSTLALGPPNGVYTITFVEPNNTAAAGKAINLRTAPIDQSGGTLSTIRIRLLGGFTAAEDVLSFTNDGVSMGNITGTYDTVTGTMTLSTSSTATDAQWQSAAGAVRYHNNSDQSHTITRTLAYEFSVSGGTAPVGGVLGQIQVVAANDSPILDPSVAHTLAGAIEDGANVPAGAVGTLVTSLANAANISDLDGANAHDGSAPGLVGLAIISADTTHGSWWYTTNNGASWARFAGTGMSAISATNALRLVADGATRVYFQPTTPNFNGALGVALSFRAWDQADGVANGTRAPLPTDAPLATGTNTDASAYSASFDQVPQNVAPVNDAPIASGTATLAPNIEDTTTPTQSTVLGLFGATFSDTADQQRTLTNLNGSLANSLAGIAIVGNTASTSQGEWRYSVDGGTTWVAVSTTVSNLNALVLSASARLEFLPAANFNGAPPVLTVRLIDSSDVAVSGTTTGANLLATTQAIAGVNVAGPNNGGTTAVSAATVPLMVVVAPVNDAPVALGSGSLVEPEDGSGTAALVSNLFGSSFSDVADQQQGPGNPTGSVANVLAGIAIVANTTPASQGEWRYSVDGGTTWVAVSTTVSNLNALVLSASARLEFVPVGDYNGTPSGLTVRLIDSSDVAVSGSTTGANLLASAQAIAGVNVAGPNNGGTTAVSAETIPLLITVTAINDAPIASGTATLAAEAEDTTTPTQSTVLGLFGGTFSDTADQQRTLTNINGSVANALAGIAIVGNTAPAEAGVWRYSLDGGTTWVAVSTAVSNANALVLSSSARLEFLPAANFNGAPPVLTVRLIDSSDVAVSGTTTGATLLATTQAIAGVDVSGANNGGTTAVSAGTVPLRITVTAVNDAPIASGNATMPAVAEDVLSPTGATVGSLFGGNFSDMADQQRTLANLTGSIANVLAGVAITTNLTPDSQGVWRFSTDGGVTWTVMATGLSASNALMLSASARLSFLPEPNFNGIPTPLTARLIDSSDVVVSGTTTGADLLAATQAIAGVNVSGANSGGTTAVSAASVLLSLTVSPVNDAPTAAGEATLAATVVGTPPRSDTVANLFAPSFGDAVDQQRGLFNPTGSIANDLAGVVVVGNTTPASEGVWRYSQDGGASWVTMPTALSESQGLVLGGNVQLSFLAAPGFFGFPAPLQVRLIDSSTDVPVVAGLPGEAFAGTTMAVAGVDVSGTHNGGTTAISADTVPLGTLILPVGPYTLTYVEPNNTPAVGRAILLPGAQPGGPLTQATLQLGGGFTAGEDVLAFARNAGTMGNIEGSYDATTGLLTLSSTGGTASEVQWRAALDAIRYFNSSDQPHTVARTVTYTFSPTAGAPVTLFAGQIAVSATNDAPVLDPSVDVALGNAVEDAGPPSGAVGTLVSTLANAGNIADLDGANAHDGSAPGPTGIAIIGVDATRGDWWFTTDGGATWTRFAGADLPALSPINALHLVADANTRLYVQPTVANLNGSSPVAMGFRAWDRADGVANGTLSALPTTPPLSTGINTAASAYSALVERVSITVDPVNDAPTAAGSSTMPTVAEDVLSATGATVGALFAANFADTADQQRNLTNLTGSVANDLAGIAIVANPTPAAQGVWRYSLDGGTTWTVIGNGLSTSNALVLSASARLSFLPAPDFNGAPASLTLTAHLIDSSDVAVSGATTGADLLATPQAIAGVNVAGPNSGGTTAVSANTVPLSISITPINDAPIASGGATLQAGTLGATPPSATVAELFGPGFGDRTDHQRTLTNLTGSIADSLAGVVVVGNTTPASIGVWKYSTDGGVTWTSVPTTVSDANGLLLGSNVRLAFFSSGTFTGSPPPLVVRLVDSSRDVPLVGPLTGAFLAGTSVAISNVNVEGANHGGITAVSDGTMPLNTIVNAAPVPPPVPPIVPPILPPIEPYAFNDHGGFDSRFLVGGNVYRMLLAERPGTVNVSADVFYGSESPRNLSFEATTIGGGPLPPWLFFDPILLRFSGTPPESAVGTLELRVIAKDHEERQATAEVHLVIVRPPRDDLLLLLRPPAVAEPIVLPQPPAPARTPEAAPTEQPQAPEPSAAPPPREDAPRGRDPAQDENGRGASLPGFNGDDRSFGLTAQMRDQSLAGRMARSRALLSALAREQPTL